MPGQRSESTDMDVDTQRLIGELSEATKQVAVSMQAVLAEQRSNDRAITEMKATLERMDRSLTHVRNVVIDGNGDSMVTRLKLVETAQSQMGITHANIMAGMQTELAALKAATGEVRDDRLKLSGGWKLLALISVILVQLATLGVSIWAILK